MRPLAQLRAQAFVRERQLERGREIAREPAMIHRIGPVRRDVRVEDRVGAGLLDEADLEADLVGREGEAFDELGVQRSRLDSPELAQPLERELHVALRNCSRNRRSFSQKSLRSGTEYFRNASRSMPVPNAKPE